MGESPAFHSPGARARSADEIPQPGAVIADKYRVGEALGRGGVGVVLAAEHVALRQPVALKLLLGDHDDPARAARFVREARIAMSLQSEHAVRVLDLGTLPSGAPYLVMERLEGSDRAAPLEARGPLPSTEAVDLDLQACEALAEAHARGVVHRDLKPSNLFLTRRASGAPLVKVLDFGISKWREDDRRDDASVTDTHATLGSPIFMSPEQVRSPKDVDARTDVWALGVVLQLLLTGEPPFIGEGSPGTFAAIVSDPPRPIARADVPAGLCTVVSACLEKSLHFRVGSVVELARLLAPFASSAGKAAAASLAAEYAPRAASADVAAPGAMAGVATAANADTAAGTVASGVTSDPPRPAARGGRRAVVLVVAPLALLALALGLATRRTHAPEVAPPRTEQVTPTATLGTQSLTGANAPATTDDAGVAPPARDVGDAGRARPGDTAPAVRSETSHDAIGVRRPALPAPRRVAPQPSTRAREVDRHGIPIVE